MQKIFLLAAEPGKELAHEFGCRRYGTLVTEALREVVEDTDTVRILSANKKSGS
jgi:hypothetical protein